MLQGCLKALFLIFGNYLTRVGYGKKGMYALNALGKDMMGLSLFWAIVSFFWALGFLLYVTIAQGSADALFGLAILIVIPVAYLLWVIFTRKHVDKVINEACEKIPGFNPEGYIDEILSESDVEKTVSNELDPSAFVPKTAIPTSNWKCTCGRTNAAYVSSCTCGMNKRDLPK